MTKRNTRKFEQFRKDAGHGEPYVLEVDENNMITIPPLTTGQILDLAEAGDNPREALKVLCGDSYEQVFELLRNEPVEVFNQFFSDLTTHFGMGNAPSPSGGN